MTGSPTDGLPWWGKAIYYVICAPVVAVEKIQEIVENVMAGKKEKS